MKTRFPIIPGSILVICIIIFSFTLFSGTENKALIIWSERDLNWEDFELVDYMAEDYVAEIHSDIICPDLITNGDSRVYAVMNPNRSKRLRDEYDSHNVLIHEQYHFNITEYCARLLRKELVEKGLGGLSYENIRALRMKYSKKLDSLQTAYDDQAEHNADTKMQRYWELQIDDWLRQTAYYANEDIYEYHDFTKNRTPFFKHIYFTSTLKVLPSYPVSAKDTAYGKNYEISFPNNKEKVIKFYRDGKLTNGGYFETAITKIHQTDKNTFEVHYYQADGSYNTDLSVQIRRSIIDENKNRVDHYLNAKGARISRHSIYETRWKYHPEKEYYYKSYFDKSGKAIANEDDVFHEKRILDDKDRTVLIENYDRNHRLTNDNAYIARYESAYTEDHLRTYSRLYDDNGQFAYHLDDYHLAYEYDERGNKVKIISLDENGEITYDKNGASIYEYTFDLNDRETSVKRYNKNLKPVVADDDYFHKVKDYDENSKVKFEASYYPGYVLRFTDTKDGASSYNREEDGIIKELNVEAYNSVFENDNNVAITKYITNDKEEIIRESYLDADENFANIEDGIVEYRYQYDDKGNQIETVAYDSLGKPQAFEADVAKIRWEYDDKGNKLKTTYYTPDGELAYATDSVTYNVYKYNDKDQLIERRNYNIRMEPSEFEGVYKTIMLYTKNGLDSVTYEYDKTDKLKKGVAITRQFYNKHGNTVKIEYYDSKNRRVKNQNGVSAIKYSYNKRAQLIGQEYLDENDRLTNNQNGVAIETWILDEMGHTLSYEYFNKYKRPVIGEFGYHKAEYEWSEIGEATKSTIYGPDLKLIEDEYGVAIYQYELANSGLIKVIERFNKDGELANNTDDVATSHYEVALNGLYFLEEEFNAEGEEVGGEGE